MRRGANSMCSERGCGTRSAGIAADHVSRTSTVCVFSNIAMLLNMRDASSEVFTALAHPTRRQILEDLKDGEMAAGEIAARFSASGPTISRHLSVLRAAGLITERRDSNRILYSLVGDRLALAVGSFLSAVCPEQIVLRTVRSKSTKPIDASETGVEA